MSSSLEGIQRIPVVPVAGDAAGKWQKTVSHEWLSEVLGANVRVHQHYFIVVKEVGIPLIQFSDTRQLVRDPLEGIASIIQRSQFI